MLDRIANLATKEIIQLVRDWPTLLFIVLGPILELVLLARATGHGVTGLPVVVVDQDRSQLSRQLVAALDNTEELVVAAHLDSPARMNAWLESGRAVLAVVLPRGLQADLAVRSPQVQLVADGSNSIVASNALGAASGALNTFAARRALADAGRLSLFELHAQVRYNPTLDVRHFAITSQLGFMIYQVVLMIASLGLARERELGTLEQLLVTPMRRLELIVGKAAPALALAGVDFVVMWAITIYGFGIPMRGSFGLLLGLSLLFIVAEIGWGLIISTLSHTQQQAVLLVFVLAMVDVSFSGYMVPVERMPAAMRALAQLFPLQHYLVIIRKVMLKGADLPLVMDQVLALAALGVISNALAAISLRRQLD